MEISAILNSTPIINSAERDLAKVNTRLLQLQREQKSDQCHQPARPQDREAQAKRLKARANEINRLENQAEELEAAVVDSFGGDDHGL